MEKSTENETKSFSSEKAEIEATTEPSKSYKVDEQEDTSDESTSENEAKSLPSGKAETETTREPSKSNKVDEQESTSDENNSENETQSLPSENAETETATEPSKSCKVDEQESTSDETKSLPSEKAETDATAPEPSKSHKEQESTSDDKINAESSEPDERSRENIHYEGDVAVYTDPATNYQYTWSNEKQEWVARDNVTYGFEDDTHTYTDAEGIKYFWDKEKHAWFPKLDDEFMAMYQLNYGFVDNTQPEKEKTEEEKNELIAQEIKAKDAQALKRKAPPPEPTWFDVDDEHNTNMYVSNLPLDTSEQEFVDFMQKCGLVMREPATGKMKVKLYTDPDTKLFKGDALCTYIRIESIDMALKLLDGADLKGNKVKVERAKFQMKGTFDPKLKPKKRRKKEKEKFKKMQEKLFDWRPERMRGARAKHEKVVIVKNVFESAMFDTDVGLILEFQQDLREECSKCGNVRKVLIYDRHPEGLAQVNMKEPEEADAVVQLLNGRWFGKRQLTAEIWDGKTKYKIAETDSQISQRLEKWDKFLEDDEQNAKKDGKPEKTQSAEGADEKLKN